ncbi:MFS transporter [Nitratireductor mangrovi]|uniref:MFS transporter n=1 Tax=Nitratireductor mangrovi TaxID=2599600 RepID=A0A5B8KZ11_9HYPH|nr:MFS transporter [Nitratireductor mangrovi]QDZ00786.1 MFS transporter [Nitratireductor mangrovi]
MAEIDNAPPGIPEPALGGARRVAALVLLLMAGILAGTQLGKIAPLIPWYQAEAGLSLVSVGWLTSTLGLFVALAALPAAFVIDRVGLYRSYVFSAAALALGSIVLALAQSPVAVIGARLIEAVGYLVIVIAIPALLAVLAPDRLRAPALAIWGGFVPLGYAVADFMSAAMLLAFTPQAFLLASAGAFAVLALAGALLAAGLGPAGDAVASNWARETGSNQLSSSFSWPVIAFALAFGAYVVLSIGFFTFLPAFVAEGPAVMLSAGVIALLVPIGNFLAGALLRGRDVRFVAALIAGGFLVSAVSAVPFFSASTPLTATLAAAVFAIAGGVIAAAVFAGVPYIVPAGGSAAIVIGLIAQSGGLGTLAGPPFAGLVIERYGWPGFGWALAVLSLCGLACIAPLLFARRKPAWQR